MYLKHIKGKSEVCNEKTHNSKSNEELKNEKNSLLRVVVTLSYY